MDIATTSPWDEAKAFPVIRGNHIYEAGPLEDGVKFFVLMLEQLGCTPMFSCEGHPEGFGISFVGPEKIARTIARCGWFTVELDRASGDGAYSMRLGADSRRSPEPWNEELRVECLRDASEAWVHEFGPLLPATIESGKQVRIAKATVPLVIDPDHAARTIVQYFPRESLLELIENLTDYVTQSAIITEQSARAVAAAEDTTAGRHLRPGQQGGCGEAGIAGPPGPDAVRRK